MDWTALFLSLRLAGWTVAILLPLSIFLGRFLAIQQFRGKIIVEALVAMPLVLPPTVLGFYLLSLFGAGSGLGGAWTGLFGQPLAFSFEGLVAASVIFNLPFAIQPAQRGFQAVPDALRDAAVCCGLSSLQTLWRIELPLAWPGVLTAMVLTFAHTLGEFGIVLMVGGSIPGETKTVAIAIYDDVQGFDHAGAAQMSAVLLGISMTVVTLTFWLSSRMGKRLG
jgi:molybdate transport system permease protein